MPHLRALKIALVCNGHKLTAHRLEARLLCSRAIRRRDSVLRGAHADSKFQLRFGEIVRPHPTDSSVGVHVLADQSELLWPRVEFDKDNGISLGLDLEDAVLKLAPSLIYLSQLVAVPDIEPLLSRRCQMELGYACCD